MIPGAVYPMLPTNYFMMQIKKVKLLFNSNFIMKLNYILSRSISEHV